MALQVKTNLNHHYHETIRQKIRRHCIQLRQIRQAHGYSAQEGRISFQKPQCRQGIHQCQERHLHSQAYRSIQSTRTQAQEVQLESAQLQANRNEKGYENRRKGQKMLSSRKKVRKYLRVRWDISFRRAFIVKPEDQQLCELIKASRELSDFARHTRELLDIIEQSKVKLSTST